MKKFLLIIALSCFLPVFADEEVYLDLNVEDYHRYKSFSPVIEKKKVEKEDNSDMVIHPFKYLLEECRELYYQKATEDDKNGVPIEYRLPREDRTYFNTIEVQTQQDNASEPEQENFGTNTGF